MAESSSDLSSFSPSEIDKLHKHLDATQDTIQGNAEFSHEITQASLDQSDLEQCLRALTGDVQVRSLDQVDRSEGSFISSVDRAANSRFSSPRFVGSGAFGMVFFVFDKTLELEVAIKLLRPSRNSPVAQKRFLEEAKIAANLTHPGIIRLYDSGMIGQIPYMTSAIVPGGSLASWIRSFPRGLPIDLACRIAMQVAEAVAFAHSKLTFHRDIKPGNILMTHSVEQAAVAQPLLTDFGLAKRWDKRENALTLEGDILGTARYMSPEQARGDLAEYSVASEVFTLGIILYELLTGCTPFHGSNNTEIRRAIVQARPESLKLRRPEVPADLRAVVAKCLEKEPRDRYDSVAMLGKELQRFLDGQPVEASRPSLVRLALWQARKHPIVSASILLTTLTIALSTIGIGIAWWGQYQSAQREHQTKIDYVELFGGLIDDVVAGEKDQQTAILDSLLPFETNIRRDVATHPNDQALQHLLSLVLHYQSVTYERIGKFDQAVQCRIRSLELLRKLRYANPQSAMFRFQYVFGLSKVHQQLGGQVNQHVFAEARKCIGIQPGKELALHLLDQIDGLTRDFDKPAYREACNNFTLAVAESFAINEPERFDQIVLKAVEDSKSLIAEHPESPLYIKTAVTGYTRLAQYASARNDIEQSLAYASRASYCFEEHMRRHFDKLWVRSFYVDMERARIDIFRKAGLHREAIELCQQCGRISAELEQVSALSLGAKADSFRFLAIQYWCYQHLEEHEAARELLDALERSARLCNEHDYSRATSLNLASELKLPDSVLQNLNTSR